MLSAIFTIIIILISTVIHEVAHGSVAYRLGDPTAKISGRLTLNPLKHLDPIGSVFLPLFLFFTTQGRGPIVGWAKPVPVNPYNLSDQKWGQLKVAIAGPAVNLLVGIIFSLAVRFVPLPIQIAYFFSQIAVYNFVWAIFNLIPIPPLDGSWILFSFFPQRWWPIRNILDQYGSFILVAMIFLGLGWIFNAAAGIFLFIAG